MKYDEFVKQVQTSAKLDSKEQAENAIKAVLETLKERIVGDEASNLAAQLPQEIGQFLRGKDGQNGQHFTLPKFYQMVSEKESVELATATNHVKAVFSVLEQAVTPGEIGDIQVNLSEDYQELFSQPSPNSVSKKN